MRIDIWKTLKVASAALGVGCLLYLFGVWLPHMYQSTKSQIGHDSYVYYGAANLVLLHKPPYVAPRAPFLVVPTNPHDHRWHLSHRTYGPDLTPLWYLYDPQFAVVYTPFVLLSPHAFGVVWESLLMCCLITYAFLLATIIYPNASVKSRGCLALSIFPAVYFSPDIRFALDMGNIDLLLTTCIAAALLSKRRTQWFAIIGQVKPFVLIPMALDWGRDRRLIPRAVVILIAGFTIGVAACGLESFAAWRAVGAHVLAQGTFSMNNWSVSFGVLRLLRWLGIWHYEHGPLPAGPRAWLTLAPPLGLTVVLFLSRRLPHLERITVCLLSTELLSPICWNYYLLAVYILVALRLRRYLDDQREAQRGDIPDASAVVVGAVS